MEQSNIAKPIFFYPSNLLSVTDNFSHFLKDFTILSALSIFTKLERLMNMQSFDFISGRITSLFKKGLIY